MPIEIVGQQLRIRVKDPKLFISKTYRTHDVGDKGKLQRITAIRKSTKKYSTQSWRLNLKDYKGYYAVKKELQNLVGRRGITASQSKRAIKLASRWWTTHRGGL